MPDRAKPKYDEESAPTLHGRRGLFSHGPDEEHCHKCGLLLACCHGEHVEAKLEEDHNLNGVHFPAGKPVFVPASVVGQWRMEVLQCPE